MLMKFYQLKEIKCQIDHGTKNAQKYYDFFSIFIKNREIDMGANLIVEMDGKKTRLHKPKLSSIRETVRETINDFTFDYSYWSFDAKDKYYTTQEQVYKDLGTDVINCAFQGKDNFEIFFYFSD